MAASEKPARLGVDKTYKLYIGGKFPRSESGRYFLQSDSGGKPLANVCRASRKDLRDSVVAARKALASWSSASAYLRGQILYRIAEMLEGRRDQFVAELRASGQSPAKARREVDGAIDRLVYFAGWSDKYQQIFSAVNPVASSHFNFSLLEPTGVVGILAPERSSLLGLIANLAPAIVGGNTVVVLASELRPLSSISLAEVIHSSDVPAGVINILTGYRRELSEHFASHMDVNSLVVCDLDDSLMSQAGELASSNLKRLIDRRNADWRSSHGEDPYLIRDTQEVKTTWHPIGV